MGERTTAGTPLRRAHAVAWAVFLGMAGMSMAFNVYHAVTTGGMPWPLAWLYGIGPLAISVGVLEFASKSPSKPLRAGAYAVTLGAMYMSSSATGTVTLHAAPPHAELLFGVILDGAALLAIRFILTGPRAADADAAAAAERAALRAQAAAERTAREHAEAALRAELAGARQAHSAAVADLEAQLARESAARAGAQQEAALRPALEAEVGALRTDLGELNAQLARETAARERAQRQAAAVPAAEAAKTAAQAAAQTAARALEAAECARSEAEQRAATAEARAAKLDRKLAAAAGDGQQRGNRKSAPSAVPADFDARAEALGHLSRNPDISGRKLGELVGKSERWGQMFKRDLAGPVPDPEAPQG